MVRSIPNCMNEVKVLAESEMTDVVRGSVKEDSIDICTDSDGETVDKTKNTQRMHIMFIQWMVPM